jgi:hypothetical protein
MQSRALHQPAGDPSTSLAITVSPTSVSNVNLSSILGLCMGAKIQILQKLIAARVIGERVRGGKRKFKGLPVANFNSSY